MGYTEQRQGGTQRTTSRVDLTRVKKALTIEKIKKASVTLTSSQKKSYTIEPLVDYSKSIIITSKDYIEAMAINAARREHVAKEREERKKVQEEKKKEREALKARKEANKLIRKIAGERKKAEQEREKAHKALKYE